MTEREILRHLLATLAYRGGKCLRDAPAGFATFDGAGKTPLAILAHMGDLLDWTLSMAQGQGRWNPLPTRNWTEDSARFHRALEAVDRHFASDEPIQADVAHLIAGPLADALTHVGQLAMLRRMAGTPVPGESYFAAEITIGRLGPDQPAPVKPFK
jgi:hypothetical protein